MQLSRPPAAISTGEVFRRFEAATPFAECFDHTTNTCPLVRDCRLRGSIARAAESFDHELDLVTLDDLVRGNCGLAALLAPAPGAVADCRASA